MGGIGKSVGNIRALLRYHESCQSNDYARATEQDGNNAPDDLRCYSMHVQLFDPMKNSPLSPRIISY